MNTNSSLFGDLLDGRLEKEDEVHDHLDDNFLAGPVDTDAHIDDSLQQQWGHHSNNNINITDDAQDGKKGEGGVSPPKMVLNSLGVMELEHRFTGTQSITTTPSSNPTSFYSSEGGNEEGESSSSSDDDDDADFIYEVDRHNRMYSTSTSNSNSNNRYQTNFLDTASSIIDNLPVFNNSGYYTGTTSRECNIDDLECMGNANSYRGGRREDRGRGREDSVSYESTSTRRYKKLKRKVTLGIVVFGLVGIVLGIYYGKGGFQQEATTEQIDRYYQIGSETDGIVVSDGVELVEGMVSIIV